MDRMISQLNFRKRMQKLIVPDDFTATMDVEDRGWKGNPMPILVYVVKGNNIEIRFDQNGSGHTLFDIQEGEFGQRTWRTFDLRGVEDSFYHLPLWDGDKTKYNINKILKDQIARVAKQLQYEKSATEVPGIPGHTVNKDQLKALKARLSKNGQISFRPGGFGTGYIITTTPVRGSKPAIKAMRKFFDFENLYVSTIEMD